MWNWSIWSEARTCNSLERGYRSWQTEMQILVLVQDPVRRLLERLEG
jgi:hypothetical protein